MSFAPSVRKRILIIDDEAAFARLLKSVLERAGPYEVRCETTGTGGIAAANSFRPHVALVDMVLPDLGGGEVAARILANPLCGDTRIIYLTALLPPAGDGATSRQMGGYFFFAKPVDFDVLLSTLAKLLS
jgi:two-component system, chemotaxis family, CheB/CheR fusion protein